MTDARFEDGAAEAPLRLIARGAEDLLVLSALIQDAVLTPDMLTHAANRRRFGLGLNRFRWEDAARAAASGRGYERVQSLLVVDEVLLVQSHGIRRDDPKQALEVLALSFIPDANPDAAPGGWLRFQLSGSADLRLKVDALEVTLRDLSRPYLAPSGKMPDHGADGAGGS